MPDLEPLPTSPSSRRGRDWVVAGAVSLGATALGVLLLLVGFGFVLEEHRNDPPPGLVALAGLDALLGLPVALAIGPMRMLSPGRLRTVSHLLAVAATGLSSWAAPAGLLALHRIGVAQRPASERIALPLLALSAVVQLALSSAAGGVTGRWDWLAVLALALLVGGSALILGKLRGTRDALLQSLHRQAQAAERARSAAEGQREAAEQARQAAERARESAESERDATAARARAEERTAIARDMHDSISHHLATISLHAGAMAFRTDLPAEHLRRAATVVRGSAQQANTELRKVLMALRTTDDGAPLATVPTLTEIVETARERGEDVQLTWDDLDSDELEGRQRSSVVALARILTEIIANAAKHAPDQPLSVTLGRAPGQVVLRAGNPLPPDPTGPGPREAAVPPDAPSLIPSTGHGLIGVQERARTLGGDARWERSEETFEVEAWIPW